MSNKPTIVIVGLLPGQANKIKQQVKTARLRFVQSKGDVPKLPNGDHIVLLVKFVRHLWTTEALKRWPRNRVHYHMGGLTELTDLLNGIAT